jgi:hypothetical protein
MVVVVEMYRSFLKHIYSALGCRVPQFLHLAIEATSLGLFWNYFICMGPTELFLVLLGLVRDVCQGFPGIEVSSDFLSLIFWKRWELVLVGSSLHPLGLVRYLLVGPWVTSVSCEWNHKKKWWEAAVGYALSGKQQALGCHQKEE